MALGTFARALARGLFSGRGLLIAVPLVWLVIFFLMPFLVVLKISVAEPVIAQPPFTPLVEVRDGTKLDISVNLGNYAFLFTDVLYVSAYLESIIIAGGSTLICLIIGYPMALYIARSPPGWRNVLLILVILPFWTSFLLRVYAWIALLKDNGTINNLLISLGLIATPIQMIQTNFAVYLAIVYTYLPFMVLPLYSTLAKLDEETLEAAADLGATPLWTFLTVTLPLSVPGIVAGCLLVFIPAIGEYVIPALLGGPDTLMIGRVLWDEFFVNRDWPIASAVAIAILLVVVVPIVLLRRNITEGVR
ncbi:MAG: ABC transporter permease subunit [Hyphomicrobiaceae bacterium]